MSVKYRINLGNCEADINTDIYEPGEETMNITWDMTNITWDSTIITFDQN